ncbi:hypothetical protein [Akkermansia glycaniphila]|uniref:Uncharacterized protein n=2 Tax=Akkermansia glycaniphila TaxID=1679444 RepID=A0A1H6MD86_9BACT|nr:hypothetical protein [Akkermansia glycaniphila]SEH97031.1 Hypothetical protein PYTT_2179 [Akkermansia glycaniphila]
MAGESYHSFVLKLRRLYPEHPLPGREEYRECLRSLAPISFASPAVEFSRYVYVRRMSWCECSWERDLLPLEEDTTILPNYVLSVPFLRYYFPMCLHIAIEYISGVYEAAECGNIDSFFERTLDSIIDHVHLLSSDERELLREFCSLMEESDYLDYLDYPYLRRALDPDAPRLRRIDFRPNEKRKPCC